LFSAQKVKDPLRTQALCFAKGLDLLADEPDGCEPRSYRVDDFTEPFNKAGDLLP
jgi:hypothetical protein